MSNEPWEKALTALDAACRAYAKETGVDCWAHGMQAAIDAYLKAVRVEVIPDHWEGESRLERLAKAAVARHELKKV